MKITEVNITSGQTSEFPADLFKETDQHFAYQNGNFVKSDEEYLICPTDNTDPEIVKVLAENLGADELIITKDDKGRNGFMAIVKAVLLVMFLASPVFAGDQVTSYTRNFGSGTLTTRSDGSRMTTQKFGNGTLSRESFRSGRSATHISTRFGSGYMTRSTGSYVRKP